jgi:hypothetical protein
LQRSNASATKRPDALQGIREESSVDVFDRDRA